MAPPEDEAREAPPARAPEKFEGIRASSESSKSAPGSGLQAPGFRFQISGSRFQGSGSGFRDPGFGIRVPGFGFRVFGFRVWGSGLRPVTWHVAEMQSGSEEGSYLRLIDLCISQLQAGEQ